MANRRMFSKNVARTDAFLDMPDNAQNLYFHLGIEADDDGFVNPKMVMKTLGSQDDNLKLLIAKGFVIPFEDGVVVITHWKINNDIRQDRYHETQYLIHKEKLSLNNNIYYLGSTTGSTTGIPRLGKVRLGKSSSSAFAENTLKEKIPPFEEWLKSVDGITFEPSLKPDRDDCYPIIPWLDGLPMASKRLQELRKEYKGLTATRPTVPESVQNTQKLVELISVELKTQYGSAPVFGKQDHIILSGLIKRTSFDFVKKYGKWFFRTDKVDKKYKYGVKAFASNDFVNRFIAESGINPHE